MRAAPEGWAVEGTEDLDRGCKDGSEAFLENCVDEFARRVARGGSKWSLFRYLEIQPTTAVKAQC